MQEASHLLRQLKEDNDVIVAMGQVMKVALAI
jgi:hypothetical protein